MFTHLHLHTEFSLLDGTAAVEALCERARRLEPERPGDEVGGELRDPGVLIAHDRVVVAARVLDGVLDSGQLLLQLPEVLGRTAKRDLKRGDRFEVVGAECCRRVGADNETDLLDIDVLLPPGDGIAHYRYVIDLKATGRPALRPAALLFGTGQTIEGNEGLVGLADTYGDRFGDPARWALLVGIWAAVFTSILGPWHGISYIFADLVRLIQDHRRKTVTSHESISEKDTSFRIYLAWMTFPPMLLLFLERLGDRAAARRAVSSSAVATRSSPSCRTRTGSASAAR